MKEILHVSIKQLQSTCVDLNLAQRIDSADLNILTAGSGPVLTGCLLSLEMFNIQLHKALCNRSLSFSERETGPCGLQMSLPV